MSPFRRWNPFRPRYIAVAVESRPEDVLRVTLSDDADLTIYIHDGGADLLWVDFDAEDSEKLSFGSLAAAQQFAEERFGVSVGSWS